MRNDKIYPRLDADLLYPMPRRLEFVYRFDISCYYILGTDNLWFSFDRLPPQEIGLPDEIVALLGGRTDKPTNQKGCHIRENYARNVEAWPYRRNHFCPPEDCKIAEEMQAWDIDLTDDGVLPSELDAEGLVRYFGRLKILAKHSTMGSPLDSIARTGRRGRLETRRLIAKLANKRDREQYEIATPCDERNRY